ncbi:sarcoplasmic calcium-binding protein-like [Liolophura sinensis]|uniref:sarcoplasmic calcium-binding protein-like n=1 Tax=Liolophura sinensis TaxID=3198878 RepID=UPI0031589D4D
METARLIDVPEHLVRKWRKLFHYRDANHDGFITEEDYVDYAENFVQKYGDRVLAVREVKELLWDTASLFADKTGVDEEGYVKSFSHLWKHDRESFMAKIEKYCNLVFDAIDLNGDDSISKEEYGFYQNCFGVMNTDYIELMFSYLYTNGDCKISRQEFVKPIMDYVFKNAPEDIPVMYDAEKAANFRFT